LQTAVRRLEEEGVESVAVCLLHAYANPVHEQRIGAFLAERHPEWFVSLSHQILREMREYERTSTTALNAYIAPVVARYVATLEALLETAGFRGQLLIMQSNGGVMSAATARQMPVAMMESGPVAGVMGSAAVGELLGYPDVLAFDMGGTTAKTSLVRGGPGSNHQLPYWGLCDRSADRPAAGRHRRGRRRRRLDRLGRRRRRPQGRPALAERGLRGLDGAAAGA
jgi:N-methylhydantoinase A